MHISKNYLIYLYQPMGLPLFSRYLAEIAPPYYLKKISANKSSRGSRPGEGHHINDCSTFFL